MKLKGLVRYYIIAFTFALTVIAPDTSYAKASTSSSKSSASSSKSKSVSSKKKAKSSKKYSSRSAVDNYSALIVDANTGQVLYEKNAGAMRYPASLTKMMTIYLTFDAIKRGKFQMNQMLTVSSKAASQPSTNISLKKGDRITVKQAIESLVVRSANDSATVVAEALGKTEWNFALMMTQKARELGMKNTVFRNPHGLPDDKQYTTAYDMARLAIALRRDFPDYYQYFSIREMTYNGVTYTSHNHLLDDYPGADGIKTGYINASGYNLVTSAHRGGFKLVGVVMGGSTARSRDREMMGLLDRSFARMQVQKNSVADTTEPSEDSSQGMSPQGGEIILSGTLL